jgi:hypothetical protein
MIKHIGFALIAGVFTFSSPAAAADIDAGLTITDPQILRVLDGPYGIGQMIPPGGGEKMSNKDLFALAPMRPILETILLDIKEEQLADPSGSPFNVKYLTTGFARFTLAGIVNRMDRAWAFADRDPASCGEIRFIYRLVYHIELPPKPEPHSIDSYLPMTINLVMRARNAEDAISCADIAKRWLRMADQNPDPAGIADKTTGVLANVDPAHIDRIEINMQSVRWGASSLGKKDFGGRANYRLRVFKFVAGVNMFVPQPMENEVDHDRLLDSPDLLNALKAFLLEPANIVALDKGILKIPDQYLATKGLSVAPGGAVRSANRILSDLVNAGDPDVVAAIDKAVANGALVTIQSAYGFERRLDDISCTGCHQTHSAAGFHFMGIDWNQIHPANTTQIAGSPHFFGDMPRRREVVTAFAEGRTPDYARGFAARALPKHATGITGTGLYDGWGGHCYQGNDPAFAPWRCAQGLACQIFDESVATPGMGICLSSGRREVGDPVEKGIITTSEFDEDTFTRTFPPQIARPSLKGRESWMLNYFRRALKLRPNEVAAHQEYDSTDLTGAFPLGMLRLSGSKDCPDTTGYPEAICAPAAGSGFNRCVAEEAGDFEKCLETHSAKAGLRRCNKMRPCRDDYLCVATVRDNSQDGSCLPPYFMFQFRVDGHPPNPPQ